MAGRRYGAGQNPSRLVPTSRENEKIPSLPHLRCETDGELNVDANRQERMPPDRHPPDIVQYLAMQCLARFVEM